MAVVVRRIQRNVSDGLCLSSERDVLPRWTPAKKTAVWAPSQVMMLLVCALLMLGIYRSNSVSVTTQVEGKILDAGVLRALRTEHEPAPPVEIILTATGNHRVDVLPSSPMPMAPQQIQPGHVTVEWADRPVGAARAHDDEGSQLPPGPSATPAAGHPLAKQEEEADDKRAIAEAKVASKERHAALAANAKVAAKASKARASAARDAEQAERDRSEVWRAAAGLPPRGSAKGRATGNSAQRAGQACIDRHTSCAHWAIMGECQKNPPYMNAICSHSCGCGTVLPL